MSFLNDAASEMVVPLLPVFLGQVLGGRAAWIGAIEGLADAVAAGWKLLAGRWGDKVGRARPFLLVGYGLAGAARATIGLVATALGVTVARMVDRVGKGLRTAPRDALLARSAPAEHRAAVYSFHRALDNGGALAGAALAWLLLQVGDLDVRAVFLVSAVPAVVALLLIAFAVRETGDPVPVDPGGLPAAPTPALRRLLGPLALFTLGRVADPLLLLRASELGAPASSLPLLWMGLHLVKVGTGLVAVRLGTRVGSRPLVLASWGWGAAILGLSALVDDPATFVPAFVAFGVYHGLSEGNERAMVADLSPDATRGTAFGWYHLTTGLGALPAGLWMSAVWTTWGATPALLAAALFTGAGTVWLGLLARRDGQPGRTTRT